MKYLYIVLLLIVSCSNPDSDTCECTQIIERLEKSSKGLSLLHTLQVLTTPS